MVDDLGLDAVLVQDRGIAGDSQARLAGLAILIGASATALMALLAQPIAVFFRRSEEHTSELQSLRHLVCRLLLEKKKKRLKIHLRDKQKHKTSTQSHATKDDKTKKEEQQHNEVDYIPETTRAKYIRTEC